MAARPGRPPRPGPGDPSHRQWRGDLRRLHREADELAGLVGRPQLPRLAAALVRVALSRHREDDLIAATAKRTR